ncbi:hypothetical protein KIW84_030232 [Lathyrus oleraceus]|uniref:RIN4 pathogenic type III effector avirulence factor Avr cleavage site domain-containing protein n=1 Tax=Pisum sativum TaxID=3888 RepID=A0A9D4XSG9_PEA|nr:hypothetical protein KIW84_030232 [Pisum sativum]
MDEYWKRSGGIPAFGNWDFANELPITQYFENARQAGLIRYSSSSGETDPYVCGDDHDLYAVDLKKPARKVTYVCLIISCDYAIIIRLIGCDYGEIYYFLVIIIYSELHGT